MSNLSLQWAKACHKNVTVIDIIIFFFVACVYVCARVCESVSVCVCLSRSEFQMTIVGFLLSLTRWNCLLHAHTQIHTNTHLCMFVFPLFRSAGDVIWTAFGPRLQDTWENYMKSQVSLSAGYFDCSLLIVISFPLEDCWSATMDPYDNGLSEGETSLFYCLSSPCLTNKTLDQNWISQL